MKRILRPKHGLEWYIQKDVVVYLEAEGWDVERLTGNAFQVGIPDLNAAHPKWGERWIDIKVPGKYSFTKAQRLKWPRWEKFRRGIWIMTAANQEQYDLLFHPPNWRDYWKPSYGELPDVDYLMEQMKVEQDGLDWR